MIARLVHYMHDYWFSRLLRRYFAVILLIMAVPMAALNVMWTHWMNRSFQNEIFSINEQALQAQINPHFISNTLMALSGSVAQIMGTDCETVKALEDFAALMRVSLTGDNYLAPLNEELEHIRLFMTLIAFRYKNRVQIEISVPPEMLDVCVPKLSLQPLIENAVNHGLRPLHYRGHIGVRGEMDGETAHIIVWDDGVGLDEREVERLNRLLERDVIGAAQHIGLSNVNQRFQLIFGGDAGVRAESRDGRACFVLTFPVVRKSGGKLV